jgi:hypothetical protein
VVRHGFLALLAIGLLCLSGLGFAEPPAGSDRIDVGADADAGTGTDGGTDAWGDPEDNEEIDRGWTWFGMGYENRRRASGQRAGSYNGPAQDHENAQGKGSK